VKLDITALRGVVREKDVSLDTLISAIETALLAAYRHSEGAQPHARVDLDRGTGEVVVWAQDLGPDGEVLREWDDTPEGFGRIATATAKQVVLQRLREAEHDVTFGNVEAVLPAGEQVPGEVYDHGLRIKCLVISVHKGIRGPHVTVSRTHPNLVRKLFALEVPEVADGTVEITGVAREAGHRTKISVRSLSPGVRARGACIGPMGSRVRAVVSELHGEKIDIIDWSEDPAGYVANALSPAEVVSSQVIDADGRQVRVIVPDYKLSLAIGREGQNARLAARLTGWRIDIRSDTAPAPVSADPGRAE
jgi:N utilization substance protein A